MAATSSSESGVWQLSVAHGKQTLVVAFQPQHPQCMALLKLEVEKLTGVAPKHQRLIYRGKELLADDGSGSSSSDFVKNKKKASPPPPLVNNAKLMLLLNQAYHQEAAKRTTSPAKPAVGTDEQTLLSSSNETAPIPAAAKKQAMAIDIDSLDDDEMLVQAFRGKANYELILKRDDVVMAVKECVSCMLGLTPQGIRLVVKGKTPKDDTRLFKLLGTGARTIKCMVLLQAQQHVVLEKEDDLRQLLNELTQLQVEAKRLEKQVARNFASREETSIRVSALVDSTQRVHSNLELLLDHLSPKGGGALTKPRANQQTTDLLTKAIQNSQTLYEACQALLQRLTLL